MFIDKEALKLWGKEETRRGWAGLESDVANAMPGSAAFSGVERLLDNFERRSFFTSVPLLLLLVVTAITVLYYILMMVSYLVGSRESDVALLRSRGVSAWQLGRIYALEGNRHSRNRGGNRAVCRYGRHIAGGQAGLLRRNHGRRVFCRRHRTDAVHRGRARWGWSA